jgi:hypothetical protein
MTENILIESVDIPEEAILTVLKWIQSEQTRVVNEDRIYAFSRGPKVDHLTEIRGDLADLKHFAEQDNVKIAEQNVFIQSRIDREIFNKAAAQVSDQAEKAERCVSYVECTCKNAF